MGQLQTNSSTYCLQDYCDNKLYLKYTLNRVYLTSILYVVAVVGLIFIYVYTCNVKIGIICHAWGLWELSRSYKQLRFSCQLGPWNLPGTILLNFEIHWVRQHWVNVVLFGIKNLWKSSMTANLKSNLYVGPVNIFPNFLHCICVWLKFITLYTLWIALCAS